MLGYPPLSIHCLSKLLMARFHCMHPKKNDNLLLHILENPISKVKGSSFPTELKSILEESRLVNKESRNNRDPRYCRLKQKHHCKLEVRSKNSTSKSPIVTELIAHLITTQSILEHLKVAKRNPVFLVLDKVTDQFKGFFLSCLLRA